jgi:hypothetical protein
VNSFSLYKASVHPGPGISVPSRGVIDLMPATATQYFLNSGMILKQNITLPSTTNRILIVFQDINALAVTSTPPVNLISGVGNGYNPATSFSSSFSNGTTANLAATNSNTLSQLWLSLPELGIQEPTPIYSFTGIQDFMRAYGDWTHITQGTHHQNEGSVAFGSFATTNGISIINVDNKVVDNSFIQLGDPNNVQQYPFYQITPSTASASPGKPDPNTYNQTAKWGWLGRIPGPIFAFPVVRPEGKSITTGTLNVTMTNSVTAVAATIIASYSMAIALELQPNGYYSYTLVEGV